MANYPRLGQWRTSDKVVFTVSRVLNAGHTFLGSHEHIHTHMHGTHADVLVCPPRLISAL